MFGLTDKEAGGTVMVGTIRALRRELMISVTLVSIPMVADQASAQATPPASPVTAVVAQDADPAPDSAQGADVVVTAQRRAERLQDVPLSITALSGEQIKNADIKDINRLEQVVPGVRISRSGPAERPAIRGIYTETTGINSDPRIGFYIDEIYQSRPQQASVGFVDLERVEVQKGPQGTLFGRNSLGGNIALTTAAPKDKFEMGADLIYGNYNRMKAEGFINVPLADGLAFRVAGAHDAHDGFLKSVVTKTADLQDLDYNFVRGSLRWTPPSLGGKLDVILRGSYYREQDHGFNTVNAKVIGALVDPSLIRAPGGSVTVNGYTYPFPYGYNGGNYATGQLYPYTTALRDGIADVNGADIGLPVPGPYESIYDFPAHQDTQSQNYTGTISYDLSDAIRLRSITGYVKFRTVNMGDGDGGPIPLAGYYNITEAQTFTEEFQIQSANRSSPLQYTLGAFYLNDTDYDGAVTYYYNHSYTTQTAAAQGLPALYAVGNTCGFTYNPTNAPFSCNITNVNSPDSPGFSYAKTKSYAGYGQASYKFFDKLTLTGGVRYTVDDKDYRSTAQAGPIQFVGGYVAAQNAAAMAAGQAIPYPNAAGYHAVFPFDPNILHSANFTCGGVTPGSFAPSGSNQIVGTVPNYLATRCGQRTFRYVTYRVAADYKLTPDNLLYASYSTGVHSGGFGTGIAVATNGQGEFATFDSEKVKTIEVGSKNQFFDRRLTLNVTGFYSVYDNVQVQGLQFVTPPGATMGSNLSTITNASGKLRAPGAEVEVIFRPTPALTLNGSMVYMHARQDVYPIAIFSSSLCAISSGAGSPCTTNAAASSAGLGSGFFPNPQTNPELFVPLTFNAAGVPTSYASLVYNQKYRQQNVPDWSAHGGASYRFDLGGSGTLTPEADVIYSGDYLLSTSTPNVLQHAYAKVDLRLTYATGDGHMTLQGFVQNLSNIATIGRATTQNLNLQGTYAEPRTYGLKLGFRF